MAEWKEVDITSMAKKTPKLNKLYTAYKARQAEATEARNAFDNAFRAEAISRGIETDNPEHVIVSHKFGKLSFAVDTEAKPRKSKSGGGFSFG